MDYKKILRRKKWCLFFMVIFVGFAAVHGIAGNMEQCLLWFIISRQVSQEDDLADLRDEYKPLPEGELYE